jgi:hypothetical protein
MNREAVVPSVFAFFAYMLAFVVLALPGGLGYLFMQSGGGPFGRILAIPGLGLLGTAILGFVGGGPAYLYAVSKFDRYEVDS